MEINEVIDVLLQFIIDDALIVVPMLMIFGFVIKKTNTIEDKWIPLLIVLLGAVWTPFLLGSFNAENITQGVLVSGLSVLLHQIYKQLDLKLRAEELMGLFKS